MRRRLLGAGAALVVAAAAYVLFLGGTSTPAPPVPLAVPADVAAQLEQLPATDVDVAIPDYSRDAFGARWADVDGNGCDTRNDVLTRDLDDVVLMHDRPCIVDTGTLEDPYTGQTIAFQHGEDTSQAVQIEHVIPLATAWRSGAWSWTDEQRLAFANDQTLLLAVDGPTNQGRGDRDLDQWLPPADAFTCTFVALVVDGLARYELSITDDARAAAATALDGCPDPSDATDPAGTALHAQPITRRRTA